MTLGLPDLFDGPLPAPEDPATDPRRVLLDDVAQLAALARQIEAVATREDLHDYGRFRLAVIAIDQLPIERGGELHTVAGALHTGAWSDNARVLAVGGLLRALGYGVVPHRMTDGQILLGLPLGGDPKHVNSNAVKANVRVRRGKGAAQSIKFVWLMWDGVGRIGEPRQGGGLVLQIGELLDGPSRDFTFTDRTLPAFTLRRPDPRLWTVPGTDLTLSWNQHDDARAWLSMFPALSFPHQARFAREELAAMDIRPSLLPLGEQGWTEVELVNTLLRTVQSHIRYEEGPLRTLFDILEDRTGDCDQLSLVLQALLVACGYDVDDLRAIHWPGHLALGLRARQQAPEDGAHIDEGAWRFHALDPAFYHRTGEQITTCWGMLHPRYARLGFTPQRLA